MTVRADRRPPGPKPRVDPRIRDRRVAVTRAQGRHRLRALVVLVVAAAAVVGGWLVLHSPLLDVEGIEVRGATQTPAAAVQAAAGVELGDALVLVDLGAAARRVERLPWVATATVERHLPGELSIRVTERTAAAWIRRAPDRVVVFDARGSGQSEGSGTFSHEQWAADIDGLRQWIGAERIIMAGGSYGGFMAMEYAIRYPDRVRALVLRDTAPDNSYEKRAKDSALASARVAVDPDKLDRIFAGRVRDNDDLRECWREILPLYDFTFDPAAVEQRVEATPYRYEAHNYAFAVNIHTYDLKPALPSITCPTLVTVGRTDWITPVECSEVIAGLVPDSKLVIFEESGHSPQIEEAEAWTTTVREFLAEVCPVPARNPQG